MVPRKSNDYFCHMDNPIKNIRNIVWDWNGTILDDISLCVESINVLLEARGKVPVSIETYKRIFGFPVKDYYERAGFNFDQENFEIPATQFMDLYNKSRNLCQLTAGAVETIQSFHAKGLRQFILSASETTTLHEMLNNHNLNNYFEDIYGLDNHYANGKENVAMRMVRKLNLEADQTILVGDTCHDAEVAQKTGWKCILFSGGHYPKNRLKVCNSSIIIDKIKDIEKLLYT